MALYQTFSLSLYISGTTLTARTRWTVEKNNNSSAISVGGCENLPARVVNERCFLMRQRRVFSSKYYRTQMAHRCRYIYADAYVDVDLVIMDD